MWLSLPSLLTPLLTGFVLVRLLSESLDQRPSAFWMRSSLATGIGLGISSSLSFIFLSAEGTMNSGLFLTELAFLAVLTGLLVYRIKRRRPNTPDSSSTQSPPPDSTLCRFITVAFLIALPCALVVYVLSSLKNPHGGWDAWSIWNMRARFIFRGGYHWTDELWVYWLKADYPLLIPAAIGRYWALIGRETVIVPALVAMLFTFSTLGLTYSSLAIARSKSQGYLAGLVLLGTPFFIYHGASQYADVPLSFFILASIVLFTLWDLNEPKKPGLLVLAGLSAGFAAWCKNEGILFVLTIVLAHFVSSALRKGWRPYLREFIPFLLGLLPQILVLAWFKLAYATTNDLISGQGLASTTARLLDLSRHTIVAVAFLKEAFLFGAWSRFFNVPLLMILYAALMRTGTAATKRASLPLITLCLMVAGYYLTYVTTPHEITWHLGTSLNRLFLHLWPSCVFLCFLIARTPEETASIQAEVAHAS